MKESTLGQVKNEDVVFKLSKNPRAATYQLVRKDKKEGTVVFTSRSSKRSFERPISTVVYLITLKK